MEVKITKAAREPSERAQQIANELICEFEGTAPHLTSADFRNAKLIARAIDKFAAEERERIAREIESPYPEDIFTPFTANELGKLSLIWAQSNEIVPHFSDRCMANWARRWAKNVRESLRRTKGSEAE